MKRIKFWAENNTLGRGIVLYALIAILIVFLVAIANAIVTPTEATLPPFLQSNSDQTQSLLLSLAGALMTVTIFLYSTTVLVLTTYSAQFTPRVIENFSNSKSIARIFGIFIGGAIYCLFSLFFINRNGNDQTYFFSAGGALYALLSIVCFIVFIIKVSRSVQVQNLLSVLNKQALETVNSFVSSRKDTIRIEAYRTDQYTDKHEVRARENGFFEENDLSVIRGLLEGEDYAIVLYPRLGDFVSKNQLVASLYYNDIIITQEIEDGLADSFILEEKRYIDNDYRFAIQKIIEVALKALSASINDPNTAIYCIRYLGILTGRLAGIDGRYAEVLTEHKKGSHQRIIDQDFIFSEDLRDMFVQIIHYGKQDVYLVVAILEALHTAWLVSTPNNQTTIEDMVAYVFAHIEGDFVYPMEKQLLERRQALFRHE